MKKDGVQIQEKEQYEKYVKQVTPTHNVWKQMAKAFVSGGVICILGQFITNIAKGAGNDPKSAGIICSLTLILLSVLLTGFHLYAPIAKWAGAGILVPITGFANGVASSAIEYKKEGQVFGVGSKIFTIAGPVILYGIVSSFLLGLIYYCYTLVG